MANLRETLKNSSYIIYLLSALSTIGILSIYNLCKKDDSFHLQMITDIHIDPASFENGDSTDVLALSLDWNSRRNASDQELEIVVSSSNGKISIFRLTGSKIENTWKKDKCHEYEAWITAFDAWNRNIIFTGGDDCLLKIFDRRSDLRYVPKNFSVYNS